MLTKASISPPRTFATISLAMIVVMLTATGLTQTPFFRQTIIEREAAIVRDMVNALALEHELTARDFEDYRVGESKEKLEQSFGALRGLSDVVLVKVFDRENVIVWSTDPNLFGTKRTAHLDHLAHAMTGQIHAVFNSAVGQSTIFDRGAVSPATIEFYVPIFKAPGNTNSEVIGVLSLYRKPERLNSTIRHGLYLLWSVISGAGFILFFALYKLFKAVYSRQVLAERKFSKLTADHQRIVQIEKLSAMGELVGEIAHQLNNPLVGVINLTQLAEREAGNSRRVNELLADVRKAGNECRDIVQRILRINQISRAVSQATDMVELVNDTIKFCQQTLGHQQQIEFRPPHQTVTLNVDPVLIRHALFNLVHNAILAAPDGIVRVGLEPAQKDDLPGYELSVSDTGMGFSPDIAAKMFEPFFTTRPEGTGLGLSVAQLVAVKHGGSIWAKNLENAGAQFNIWLPAVTVL